MIFKNDIEEMFTLIKKIENVEELRIALRSKNKLQDFSKRSGISLLFTQDALYRVAPGCTRSDRNIKGFRSSGFGKYEEGLVAPLLSILANSNSRTHPKAS